MSIPAGARLALLAGLAALLRSSAMRDGLDVNLNSALEDGQADEAIGTPAPPGFVKARVKEIEEIIESEKVKDPVAQPPTDQTPTSDGLVDLVPGPQQRGRAMAMSDPSLSRAFRGTPSTQRTSKAGEREHAEEQEHVAKREEEGEDPRRQSRRDHRTYEAMRAALWTAPLQEHQHEQCVDVAPDCDDLGKLNSDVKANLEQVKKAHGVRDEEQFLFETFEDPVRYANYLEAKTAATDQVLSRARCLNEEAQRHCVRTCCDLLADQTPSFFAAEVQGRMKAADPSDKLSESVMAEWGTPQGLSLMQAAANKSAEAESERGPTPWEDLCAARCDYRKKDLQKESEELEKRSRRYWEQRKRMGQEAGSRKWLWLGSLGWVQAVVSMVEGERMQVVPGSREALQAVGSEWSAFFPRSGHPALQPREVGEVDRQNIAAEQLKGLRPLYPGMQAWLYLEAYGRWFQAKIQKVKPKMPAGNVFVVVINPANNQEMTMAVGGGHPAIQPIWTSAERLDKIERKHFPKVWKKRRKQDLLDFKRELAHAAKKTATVPEMQEALRQAKAADLPELRSGIRNVEGKLREAQKKLWEAPLQELLAAMSKKETAWRKLLRIRQALKKCEAVGVPESDETMAAAAGMVPLLDERKEARKQLTEAMNSRVVVVSELRAAIQRAEDAGIDENENDDLVWRARSLLH